MTLIRLWDATWQLVHTIEGEHDAPKTLADPAQFTLGTDHEVARWLLAADGDHINVTIDTDGQRWHGVVSEWSIDTRPRMTITCQPSVVIPRTLWDHYVDSARQAVGSST